MSKKYLDRNAILGTPLRTKEINVPAWGGKLLIREPSALAAALVANMPPETPAEERSAWWFVLCVVDENGKQIFGGDDIPALVEQSWSVLSDIVSEILDFSGLTGNERSRPRTNGRPSD
jgi:hypothetical protein